MERQQNAAHTHMRAYRRMEQQHLETRFLSPSVDTFFFFFFALFHCNGGCRCRDVLGGGGGAQTWHESPRASGSLSLQVPQVGRTVRNIDRAQQFLQLATTVVRKDKRPLLLLAVWRWQQRQNTRVRGTGRARATQ